MISDDRQMILKVKGMSGEEKKNLADKLDEWTVSRIENCATRKLILDDIKVADISGNSYYIQMDELYLYHYLLGLPLYIRKRSEEDRKTYGEMYGEVLVKSYKCEGKPFTLLCLVSDEEFNELYKDIVVEE